jgi:hypothetical protein
MEKLFNDFLLEKECVNGLSKVTLKGYRVTLRTFKRIVKEPSINRAVFFEFVKGMMDEGLPYRHQTSLAGLNWLGVCLFQEVRKCLLKQGNATNALMKTVSVKLP